MVGSGSGMIIPDPDPGKTFRIRPDPDPDPDPKHCFLQLRTGVCVNPPWMRRFPGKGGCVFFDAFPSKSINDVWISKLTTIEFVKFCTVYFSFWQHYSAPFRSWCTFSSAFILLVSPFSSFFLCFTAIKTLILTRVCYPSCILVSEPLTVRIFWYLRLETTFTACSLARFRDDLYSLFSSSVQRRPLQPVL